jgi:hypothetical protein
VGLHKAASSTLSVKDALIFFDKGAYMHGLIFVTWEKYLSDRFGGSFLEKYRKNLGQTSATAPLADHVYSDELLLTGVKQAHALSGVAVDTLLREYGYFFLLNGLTSHLCAYLLHQVHSGRELLLMMRTAHAQISQTNQDLAPPIFEYQAVSTNPKALLLVYQSHRQLCPVLLGAIEGAAARYGQQVAVQEQQCMRRGAAACRFLVEFSAEVASKTGVLQATQDTARWQAQQQLAELVYSVLSERDGLTLAEIQARLRQRQADAQDLRPYRLVEALHHLQHSGWVASTAGQEGDTLTTRRYWRLPTARFDG